MSFLELKKKFPAGTCPESPFYVSVAGNIGVGKSMITTMIGEVLGWRMYYEPVINNPYLDDYYKDMKRWSFHLQVYFLSKRFEVQKEILDHPGSAVQDRTIYEDAEIFAAALKQIFRNMSAFLTPPDLIIYLSCRPETAMNRIRKRGRDCEAEIPLEFLKGLHAAYDDWIDRAPALCPVHVIDTEQINLRDDSQAQIELIELILDHHRVQHEKRGGAS